MKNTSKTYIATPPGATVREQLQNRGMTQKEFAARMDMSEKHISKFINGEVLLTPDMAMRLEMVLGLPAHFWMNLESIYREKLCLVEEENAMDEDIALLKNFPYSTMAKYKWVQATRKPKEKVIALRKFFELVKLTLLSRRSIPGIAYRCQAATEKMDYALLAWAQKAKLEARQVKTAPVDLKTLQDALPRIRAMTKLLPKDFSLGLQELLANSGIALVYLPHIKGTFLHGATFYDNEKIVVGLTLRGKAADKFWFSLFHELGHVLLGHIDKQETTIAEEEEANLFARDLLIPAEDFRTFTDRETFTRASVLAFSEKEGIAAGITVGRLQKEGLIKYSQFNDLKTEYSLDI